MYFNRIIFIITYINNLAIAEIKNLNPINKAKKILKLALTIIPALKIINYTKEASKIIYIVNTSSKE